ncbi:C40 family peptidase [Williamsia deligens]|uniref:C40 family peptidase n=1 Tax=Williamsia deligens TaxID=321325 RepID=A0ABW3G9U4_9NOCA|nr:C40 family peptidase [Williamsia deligens]MCP2196151.1 NlpC/P60 family protein [Williamsia deligens]
MIGPVAALAAPLRALLDAVGTGHLPADGPIAQLRCAADALDRAGTDLDRATSAVPAIWDSSGADAAVRTVGEHRRHVGGLADDVRAVADIGDEAGRVVAEAARSLRTVLDSFVAAADALGPAATTPAGLPALVSIGVAHLQRALTVIGQAQARLTALTQRLQSMARRRTPAVPDPGRLRRPAASPRTGGAHPTRGRAVGEHRPGGGDHGTAGATTSPAGTHDGAHPGGRVPITLPDGSVAYAPNERAATAVRAALSQRGVPYAWGGTTPGQGLDCSALTQYAYRQAGVELPRLAQDQDTAGFRVDRGELLPGDLAVWSGHVAMIVGNGQMIEDNCQKGYLHS